MNQEPIQIQTQQEQDEFIVEVAKNRKRKKNDYSVFCLSKENVWKIYDAIIDIEDKAKFLLMYQSALREHEVAYLKIDDVDWEQKCLNLKIYKGYVNHPKAAQDLVIPISDKCYELLRIIKAKREKGWLFVGKTPSKHINTKSINYMLATAANNAGVKNPIPPISVMRMRRGKMEEYIRYKNVNPHLLRHSGVRHYLDNGGDIRMAQKLARHENIELTIKTYGAPGVTQRIDEFRRVVG